MTKETEGQQASTRKKIITKVKKKKGWRTHTADVSTTLAVDVAFKLPATDVMISDIPDISEKG